MLRIVTFISCLIFFSTTVRGDNEKVQNVLLYLDSGDYAIENLKRGDRAVYYAMKAEQLANEIPDIDVRIKLRIQLNFISCFRRLGQKELTIKHLRNWLALYETTEEKENTILHYINLSRLATDFMRMDQMDSAYKYYKIAVEASEDITSPVYVASAQNNLGLYFVKIGEWEKAHERFQKAMKSFSPETEDDSLFLVSVKDNIADYQLNLGNRQGAIDILTQNLIFLRQKPKEYRRRVDCAFGLVDLLIEENRLTEASEILEEVLPSMSRKDAVWYLKQELNYKQLEIKIAQKMGGLEDQLKLHQELRTLMENRLKILTDDKAAIAQMVGDYTLQSVGREIDVLNEKIEREKQSEQMKSALFIISVVVLLLVGSLLLVNYKRRLTIEHSERMLKEKELELTELENEKLYKDLHNQSNDFSDLVMQISLKEDWNQDIIERLQELSQGKESVSLSEVNNLIRTLKQKSMAYDKVSISQKGIKEINSAFFSRLDEKFPNLTKAERELCGLIRLRMDGKEIATIRNIHPSSVRKLRHRLRKKLSLEIETDIYDYISKI